MANSKLATSTRKKPVTQPAVAEAMVKTAAARAKTPAAASAKTASKKTAKAPVTAKDQSRAPKSAPAKSATARPGKATAAPAKSAKPAAKPAQAPATKAGKIKAAPAPAARKDTAGKAPIVAMKVQPASEPAAGKTAVSTASAPARAAAPAAAPRKVPFKANELVVYPAHGVGRVVQIEEQEIAGVKLELYIIDFEKEKLRLKVPTNKADQKGMRRLADKAMVDQAMHTLRGRARIKRTMWSRRAQEYEAKINSGDIISVAEVVRDLYRSDRQPEQSYSERQLFEQALDRMAREIAAIKRIDDDIAVKELEDFLSRHGFKKARVTDEDLTAEEEAA